MMMMEVSATSLLVILGIFCSAALAQPSQEAQEAMRCMQPSYPQCFGPLAAQYQGMSQEQILNQIKTTDLAQTCGPVVTAMQCMMNKMSECGLDELDDPRIVAGVKQMRVTNITVDYVCLFRVEVFNQYKECLLSDTSGDVGGDLLQQCPIPSPGPNTPFCIPQGFPECVANLVQRHCGEEIGDEFRSLGEQVLQEAGCPARKLFKMMKKETHSPLERMLKQFSSFF